MLFICGSEERSRFADSIQALASLVETKKLTGMGTYPSVFFPGEIRDKKIFCVQFTYIYRCEQHPPLSHAGGSFPLGGPIAVLLLLAVLSSLVSSAVMRGVSCQVALFFRALLAWFAFGRG